MNELPVMSKEMIEQAELRARINLANRPRLGTGLERLNEVSGMLATSKTDRSRFLSNPASYLNQQAIHVSDCNLVEAKAWEANPAQEPLVLAKVLCVVVTCENVDAMCVLDCNPIVLWKVQGIETNHTAVSLTNFEELL